MSTSRRLTLSFVIGAVAWISIACGGDASVAADAVPLAIDPPTPIELDSGAQQADASTAPDEITDTAPVAAPARRGSQQAASVEVDDTYQSIREVDFMNGFTFVPDADWEFEQVTVEDGSYENGEFGDPDYFWFGVTEVEFGDLDDDGVDEAIVATAWNGGGTGYFDSVRAFRLKDGVPTPTDPVPFGDRGDGGIFDVGIDDGNAYVWSFTTTQGACCPNQITRDTLVLGEHWLERADRGVTRAWMSLSNHADDDELKFLPGTSSAVVAMYGHETIGNFIFEAAAGQRLTLALTNGPAPADISVIATETGQVMSGLAGMVLPVDGFYQVLVSFEDERDTTTIFDVIIDAGEPAPPIRWTPVVEQTVVTNEPFVRTSLVWPVFESAEPGAASANQALATYVTGLDDVWLDYVNESPALDDSSYDVSFEVTLATSDLASVRFDYYDYVCCLPHPNYGSRGVVLDLTTGRVLPMSEILDTNRLDEVHQLWIDELAKQGLLPEVVEELSAQSVQFDSLNLVPEGVEFGTDRNSLGGGFIGTSTVVTFEQLGDLVNPAIVARAISG